MHGSEGGTEGERLRKKRGGEERESSFSASPLFFPIASSSSFFYCCLGIFYSTLSSSSSQFSVFLRSFLLLPSSSFLSQIFAFSSFPFLLLLLLPPPFHLFLILPPVLQGPPREGTFDNFRDGSSSGFGGILIRVFVESRAIPHLCPAAGGRGGEGRFSGMKRRTRN